MMDDGHARQVGMLHRAEVAVLEPAHPQAIANKTIVPPQWVFTRPEDSAIMIECRQRPPATR